MTNYMSNASDTPPAGRRKPAKQAPLTKEERLAEALRANLRRRKAPRRDENAADAADDGSENSPERS